MALSDIAIHSMLANFVGKSTPSHVITALSLHTSTPDNTGSNEVTDTSYSKITVSETDFDAPNSREIVTNNDKTFSADANREISHVGLWDGSDWLGYGTISGDTQFNSSGEFVLQAGTKIVGS